MYRKHAKLDKLTDYETRCNAVCKELGITIEQYNWFKREGKKLHKIYENECNGLYTDIEEYNEVVFPVEHEVNLQAKALNLYIYYQTDPRGATLYLSLEPIDASNYDHAYCIY